MSTFLEEIEQQPAALRTVLEHYRGEGRSRLEALRELCEGGERRLLFTGMGSSYFAPMAIRQHLTAAGVETSIWEAGELLHYYLKICTARTVVVAVSQSGESFETRRVVEQIGGQCRVVSITNAEGSFLGHSGDIVLPLCAGEEAAISTKTYTNTLAVLHLLATVLTGGDVDAESERVGRLAEGMEAFLADRRGEIEGAAEFLEGVPFLYFIARGPSLTAAHQAALTFNEGAGLPTCALPGGTFRHGPLELAGEGFAGVFFAPAGRTREITVGVAREVAQEGGRVLLLADEEDVDRVGLGVPTTLDEQGGMVACPNLPTMGGFRIGRELEDALGRPVVLENDANCFAYGEWYAGAGKGTSICCGITLGTGLGMGIVMEGRIYRGSHGSAGEIWFSPYGNGRRVEEIVSGPGVAAVYRERAGQALKAREIAERAREGEEAAVEVWRTFGEALGFALSYVVNVLDPEVVVIGGSVGAAHDLFEGSVRSVLERYVYDSQAVRIAPASLGKVAGALGAALLR